ncbi:permease prefix domain 1-containing protein [Cellulomonas soli]
MEPGIEAQVDRWRGYVQRRQAVSPADVDELEDHLRTQVDDLRAGGLDGEEAFLIAIKRLGDLDAISREYAQEHSERLWKQLVLVPEAPPGTRGSWHELAVVLALALGAGASVKAGTTWVDEATLVRVVGLLVAPFLVGYFVWKRRITALSTLAVLGGSFLALSAVLVAYPFDPADGSTAVLAAVHAPVVLWVLVALAYTGGRWRSDARRMDVVRFTGELAIYLTLLALGGGVLLGLTAAVLSVADVDTDAVIGGWVLPFAVPGALVVAAWLVEAKQDVVENIAPVLTRVFTPLTLVMLVAVLVALAGAGGLVVVDRDLLIVMDAILVLVLCLLLYSISARDPLAPPGVFDAVQLVLVVAALTVDAVLLTAMVARIAQFGTSPNKLAALGLNVLLLVHLLRAGWLTLQFLRRRCGFAALEGWQTRYLPVYGVWATLVVVVFPPVFGFA